MMNQLKRNLALVAYCLLTVIFFTACEQKINVNYRNGAPNIVIEGNVFDTAGPYKVTMTKTQNYTASNNTYPTISGATVLISDDAGNSDSLKETSSGVYQTTTLQGVPGRTYRLKTITGGTEYDAVCKMPLPVPIDSVYISSFSFGGRKTLALYCQYRDPAGIANYYRVVAYLNGAPSTQIIIAEDRLTDGKIIQTAIFDQDLKPQSGDSILIQLWSIDKNIYNYLSEYKKLSNTSNSPGNPISNVSGNVLGYFSAQSVRSKLFIVP